MIVRRDIKSKQHCQMTVECPCFVASVVAVINAGHLSIMTVISYDTPDPCSYVLSGGICNIAVFEDYQFSDNLLGVNSRDGGSV